MIEELIKRLPTIARVHGRVHQFAQVLDARVGFRRVFLFQLLNVSSAVNQELQESRGYLAAAPEARNPRPLRRWRDGRPRRPLVLRESPAAKSKLKVARSKSVSLSRSCVGTAAPGCPAERSSAAASASDFARRRLLHPLQVSPAQHRAPVFNQLAKALQRPPTPAPATTGA